MKTELNLAGESDIFDTLHTACSYYILSQMKVVKNAIYPDESRIALKRISDIQVILKQIESLPAKPN